MTTEKPDPDDVSLDSELREELAAQDTPGIPGSDVSSIETARELFRAEMTAQKDTEVNSVRNFSIPGPRTDIPIRTYTPIGEGPFSVIMFFHGGGWVLGDLDCYDSLCTHLAASSGYLVVSCDYRLAPEHPFPAAPKDCYAATCWVRENVTNLNGDPSRLAVAGPSAGGNLATVVALLSRDRDGPDIDHQILLYPSVNPIGLNEFESYRTYSEGYALTTASMYRFYREYLADPLDGRNAYAFPLQSNDLSGLPSATIVSAEFDPLKDEVFEYAYRLESEDVPVSHHHFESMSHEFLSMTSRVETALEGISVISNDLQRSFNVT